MKIFKAKLIAVLLLVIVGSSTVLSGCTIDFGNMFGGDDGGNNQITNTIYFDAQGGQITVDSITVLDGNLAYLPSTPTKEGYTFEGWYTRPNGEGTKMNETFTPNSSFTIYANWTQDMVSYTITFDPKGGFITETVFVVGQGGTLPYVPTPIKTGYTFDGWYTGMYGAGLSFNANSSIFANDTYYANWILGEDETYTVYFYENGGTAVPNSYVESGTAVGELPTPTKEGYTFDGWYLDSNFTQALSSTTIITANSYAYAKWVEENTYTYTITFNSAGGSAVASIEVPEYTAVGDLMPQDPTKIGYTFNGWFSSLLGSGTHFDSTTVVTMNTTWYAAWSVAGEHSVTVRSYTNGNYSYTGGTVKAYLTSTNNDGYDTHTYSYNDQVTIIALPESGYTFDGWYKDSAFSVFASIANSYSFPLNTNSDLLFYAKFTTEQVEQQTIYTRAYTNQSYGSTGGTVKSDPSSGNNDQYDSYIHNVGQQATIVATPKAGYTFNGWYSSSSFNTLLSLSANYSFIVSTEQTNFYANFIEDDTQETLTITVRAYVNGLYSDDGGYVKAGSTSTNTDEYDVKSFNYEDGDAYPILNVIAVTKSGYEFLGWFTSISSNTPIATGSTFNIELTENTTLYAIFQQIDGGLS